MPTRIISTFRNFIKRSWFYPIAIMALVFVLGCPPATTPTTGTPAPAAPAAMTIVAAGSCPGGKLTIVSGPDWTQVTGAWQLSFKVCLECPNNTGVLAPVTGSDVTGEVNDDTFAFLSQTKSSGVTGADGCVRLVKRVANGVKTALSGKSYLINAKDASGNGLLSEVITFP